MEFRELSEKEFVSYLNKSELNSFMQSPKMDIKGVCAYYVGVIKNKKVVAAARLTARTNRFGYTSNNITIKNNKLRESIQIHGLYGDIIVEKNSMELFLELVTE